MSTSPAILVVDDEPQVRKVVRSVLEADGYTVAEAADGPAALLLLNSINGPRGPHLVVLDVMMPGIDGIRSEEHTSELQSLMRISYAVFCLKKTTKEKII